jgi:hypothetical protein
VTELLLELQQLDSAIVRLRARQQVLESGEAMRVARATFEQEESKLGEARLNLDTLAIEQKRLEYDIDAFSQKAAAEEKRLYDGSVANGKELESIQHEIANLKTRRGRLEDDLLERLQLREDLEAEIAASETTVSESRTALEKLGLDSEAELAEIAATLTRDLAERGALAANVDEETLELYEDLRSQKKGVGAAALTDGICQGCHEKLSAMELDKLKKTAGLKRCDYCRRILIVV